MKVVHRGAGDLVVGGFKTSIENQRKALELAGVEYTTEFDPDADILHLNVPSPSALAQVRRAHRNGMPVVMHTHEIGENFAESFRFSTPLSPVVRRYVDFFYRRADLLIAPTPYTKRVLAERVETDAVAVTSGVDPDRFDGVEEMGIERPEEFHVVNLSILFNRKGVEEFVETAEQMPEVRFTWYGKKYSSLLLESGVERAIETAPENASFPGYIDDPRDAFAAADAFFFPTKSETQGLSVFEAAYCGVPPVIRDIPVYEDIFTHEEDCLKAEGVDGFVEQLRRLEEDRELRERIGENGRELGREHTLDAVGEKLLQAYERALERA